ncbi:MAG: hypothetical protein DRG31_00170 [Deltaproteobacteria bacterium]|nr:MAG: hypothetical protein DRG31_00170 [Deltaproteobacteria bacterium]
MGVSSVRRCVLLVPSGENRKSTWEEALDLAFDLARERLSEFDPSGIAQRAGVLWMGQQGAFEVPFFGKAFKVFYPQGEVYDQEGRRTHRLREVLILHYLIRAKGTKPRGSWMDFRKLPGGAAYYPVFWGRIIGPLLKLFGDRPQALREIAPPLGGRPLEMGDGALVLRAFPRVEVVFGVWGRRDDFPPEGFVLFDPTIVDYLSTEDTIWVCHEALSLLKAFSL